MSDTRHQLVIYKKPKQAISGTPASPVIDDRILATYQAYNYKHQILAMGGDDNASCDLSVNQSEAFDIFGSYLGNRVQTIVNNPSAPIFEGLINRISVEIQGFKFSVSLDTLGNRVMLSYFNPNSSPNSKVTTEVTNADSIAVYGSKMMTQDLGIEYAAGDTRHNTQRDKLLEQQADPYKQMTVTPTGNASNYNVKLEIRGFYHTLGWDTFEVTSTATNNDGVPLAYMFTTFPAFTVTGYNSARFTDNGYGVFYNTEDNSLWNSNIAYVTDLEKRGGQSHLDFLRQHVEPGDGVNDWVFGITRTDPNLGYRRGYYRQANTDVEYYTNMFRDRRIYTPTGELLDPWTITPDASIRILDLPSFNTPLNSEVPPTYITKINYDGETRQVTWASKEDLTLSGQYQTGKVNKTEGASFGRDSRRVYY